jgi:hypothetical protein
MRLLRLTPARTREDRVEDLAKEGVGGATSVGLDAPNGEATTKNSGSSTSLVRPGILTEEIVRLNLAAAQARGVESAVHPADFIYWFACTHPSHTLESAIEYYFSGGERSARQLANHLAALGYGGDRSVKLLEFASGYGCVSRHLKKYPRFDLVSCDIHPEAMDFIANEIGVKTMPSVHVPEQFSPPEKYDVVFALSFFSHMPKTSFGRWIRALYEALAVPGYLVFTTHGLKSLVLHFQAHFHISESDLSADGFWFAPESEQADIEAAEYGSTISTPDFVIGEIYRQTGAPIVLHKQAEWFGHQDLWVIKREK